jgi:hypothetical protein
MKTDDLMGSAATATGIAEGGGREPYDRPSLTLLGNLHDLLAGGGSAPVDGLFEEPGEGP